MLIGILEDNEAIRDFLETGLQLHGHTTRLFGFSRPFIDTVVREAPGPYDLIICDLMLPGDLSGAQVIQRIRERLPHLPAIVISGASSDALAAAKRALLDVPVIQKPFSFHRLMEQIRHLTTSTSTAQQQQESSIAAS